MKTEAAPNFLTYSLATDWPNGTTDVRYEIWNVDPCENDMADPIRTGTETLRHEDSEQIRLELLAACVAHLEHAHSAKYLPGINRELPNGRI